MGQRAQAKSRWATFLSLVLEGGHGLTTEYQCKRIGKAKTIKWKLGTVLRTVPKRVGRGPMRLP